MKVLVVSQVYWPDSTAVSQIATDLAEDLARRGHEVAVLTSRSQYENPSKQFAATEVHRGVLIRRLRQTAFGKRHVVGRVADFLSYLLCLLVALLREPAGRYDVLLAVSVPPMSPLVALLAARVKGIKLAFWAMDLQPEVAIAAGYMRGDGLTARIMASLARLVYRRADLIITLDRYMSDHIGASAGQPAPTVVVPVWAVSGPAYDGPRTENPFRQANDLGDRIVVMYSGNHSVYNPLDTLLEAARLLRSDGRFLFVFIGGGVRKKDVTAFKDAHGLDTIRQLPLQERDSLPYSLGAADLHVVSLGDHCAGYVHPSKFYGAMFVGRPILYLGPRPSYVTDILADCPGNLEGRHGDAELLAAQLRQFAGLDEAERRRIGAANATHAARHYTRERLGEQIITALETLQPAGGA